MRGPPRAGARCIAPAAPAIVTVLKQTFTTLLSAWQSKHKNLNFS